MLKLRRADRVGRTVIGVLGIWERSLERSEEASRVSETENQLVHLKGACPSSRPCLDHGIRLAP